MSTSDTLAAKPTALGPSAQSGAKRIDQPHSIASIPQNDGSEFGEAPLPLAPETEDRKVQGEELLRLHAESLIRELREWADALESQSAALNVRSAMQDQRETQFRLWESSQRQQLSELSSAAEMRYAAAKEAFVRAAISEYGNKAR